MADCPTCGHAVTVDDHGTHQHYRPIGCFQVVDDHEVCDKQQARLVAALEVIADRGHGDCRHHRGTHPQLPENCPRCVARRTLATYQDVSQ